jgi:hypothetical protein
MGIKRVLGRKVGNKNFSRGENNRIRFLPTAIEEDN